MSLLLPLLLCPHVSALIKFHRQIASVEGNTTTQHNSSYNSMCSIVSVYMFWGRWRASVARGRHTHYALGMIFLSYQPWIQQYARTLQQVLPFDHVGGYGKKWSGIVYQLAELKFIIELHKLADKLAFKNTKPKYGRSALVEGKKVEDFACRGEQAIMWVDELI
ncbi:hypothetical protein L211DRAFT_844519 [Terfezia boudieri ATCC MYA-4762]|uniref:Uncharacterized protein n=1 Tax=Terfezia boudieri ATCC MYA-4762 TaxID=1051890 RepID=A0A3N4M7G0_9PEZI|nr:hypothetical protein L211DRAFT_844519 [Terfezia boudieri ATCC MYA-4762]